MSAVDDQVRGLDVTARAEQLAKELGYGPGGKPGGVLLLVVDHDDCRTLFAHAGDESPMFAALRFAVDALIARATQLLGGSGEPVVSSVRRWREGRKSS